MEKIQIPKDTVQETCLVPLYARKLGSELFPRILCDPYAQAVLDNLDCDLSAFDKKKGTLAWQFGSLEGLLRSRDILWEMQEYLSAHPDSAVVNMGCGLDQTPLLGDNGRMRLYNVDRADMIAIRNTVLPPIARETNLAADLRDAGWFRSINGSCGIFLFAAGVFMYLKEKEVRRLVLALKDFFPHGCLVFDTVGRLAIQLLMKNTLEAMGIHGITGTFYSSDPRRDLLWDQGMNLSVRKYLTGYVDLKQAGVPLLFRGTACLFDRIFQMNICRLTW